MAEASLSLGVVLRTNGHLAYSYVWWQCASSDSESGLTIALDTRHDGRRLSIDSSHFGDGSHYGLIVA